jgi:hypothetical protein
MPSVHVGLAEQQRPGGTQPGDDGGVFVAGDWRKGLVPTVVP